MSRKIRVLIADDHALLREGLRRILELEPDIEVVAEAADGETAVALATELRPDVVLMDVTMPGGGGLAATRAIHDRLPGVDVIVLTIHDDDEYVIELVNAGATGYLLKDVDPARLMDAIRRVKDGETFIAPNLVTKVFQQLQRRDEAKHASAAASQHGRAGGREPLTERELEILQLIVDGYSNKQIARSLYISEKTVKNHVTNLLRKLDLSDRTQAAVYAIRTGLAVIHDGR